MSHAPDRKKLRRKYVKRRTLAGIKLFLYIQVSTHSFALALLLAFIVYRPLWRLTPFESSVLGTYAALLALCSMLTWKVLYNAHLTKAYIPYVPPFTPNTLSDDEILVRGFAAPAVVQSEVLLRSAMGGETRREELLRSPEK